MRFGQLRLNLQNFCKSINK